MLITWANAASYRYTCSAAVQHLLVFYTLHGPSLKSAGILYLSLDSKHASCGDSIYLPGLKALLVLGFHAIGFQALLMLGFYTLHGPSLKKCWDSVSLPGFKALQLLEFNTVPGFQALLMLGFHILCMDQALKVQGLCIFAWIQSLTVAGIQYCAWIPSLINAGIPYTLHGPSLENAGILCIKQRLFLALHFIHVYFSALFPLYYIL